MSIFITPNRRLIGIAITLALSLAAPILRADPLHEAVAALDAPNQGKSHAEAFDQLIELNTPESLREILGHFPSWRDQGHLEVEEALIKPEHLPQVLKNMQRLLPEPDFEVNEAFLSFFMFRSFTEQHPQSEPENYFSPEHIAAQQKYNRKQQDYNWAFLQKTAQLCSLKRGHAQTSLVLALYGMMDNAGPDETFRLLPYTTKEFVALRIQLQAELALRLDQLPKDALLTLLDNHQKAFLRPALLPILLRLYDETSDRAPHWDTQIVHNRLLRRIHALAPEEAQKLLLRDLRRGESRFETEILQELPPNPAADMDDIILHLLANEDSTTATELLNRYGSSKLAPQIRELYMQTLKVIAKLAAEHKHDGGARAREAGYLAYLLKFDPEGAQAVVEKALEVRNAEAGTALLRYLLDHDDFSPFLQKLLITQLNNSDLPRAATAAQLLSQYGDKEARNALWQRLECYHQPDQAQPQKPAQTTLSEHAKLGISLDWSLAQALSSSSNWVLNKAEMQHLADLCTSSQATTSVQYWLKDNWGGPVPIRVSPGANEHWPSLDPNGLPGIISGIVRRITSDQWRVGGNSFGTRDKMLRKIAQYPPHTVFSFQICGRTGTEDEHALFELLKKEMTAMDFELVKGPKWLPSPLLMAAESP